MKHPHIVRLDGPDGSLRITRRVSDLEFTNIENGGYGSGSFTMQTPIDRKQLEAYGEVLIFDGRNGNQVGGGRILTPGRSSTDRGQVSNIAFLGEGPAAMGAVERPYFLIDGNTEYWTRHSRTTKRMEMNQTNYPNQSDDETTLLLDTTEGVTMAANSDLIAVNKLPVLCGMQLGGFGMRHKAGANGGGVWFIRMRAYTTDMTTFTTPIDNAWTVAITGRRHIGVGDFPAGRTVASISWKNLSAVATVEDTWCVARDILIRSQIYGADGTLRTTGYANEYVTAGEAFTDWCVRSCPTFDIAGASIAAGTYQFDQLSWVAGIDGLKLMEELLAMEQTLMWGVFEKQPNGLFRTELVERSTVVRYEVSIKDGYDESGPADELCNVVYVTWTSKGGRPQVTRVPTTGVAPVPDLDARGGHEQSKVLALGDEVGSTGQALQRGQEYLDAHAVIPNGGTLTINGASRIIDNLTGRRVAPWEIQPGYVCRIQGLSPRPDTLNPDGSPDGSTLARIVSMNWQDSRATAELQLDSYPLDQYHMIADLMKKRR